MSTKAATLPIRHDCNQVGPRPDPVLRPEVVNLCHPAHESPAASRASGVVVQSLLARRHATRPTMCMTNSLGKILDRATGSLGRSASTNERHGHLGDRPADRVQGSAQQVLAARWKPQSGSQPATTYRGNGRNPRRSSGRLQVWQRRISRRTSTLTREKGSRELRLPNVPLLSCGRISKPRARRWQRASPWYFTTGEKRDAAGCDEARPSASTACWAARRSAFGQSTMVAL